MYIFFSHSLSIYLCRLLSRINFFLLFVYNIQKYERKQKSRNFLVNMSDKLWTEVYFIAKNEKIMFCEVLQNLLYIIYFIAFHVCFYLMDTTKLKSNHSYLAIVTVLVVNKHLIQTFLLSAALKDNLFYDNYLNKFIQ